MEISNARASLLCILDAHKYGEGLLFGKKAADALLNGILYMREYLRLD